MNLKVFLCENFECSKKEGSSLIFTFKNENFRISRCSIFRYELLKDGTLLFSGSRKQLITYLLCFKEYYKSNEIILRNPEKVILPEIVGIYNGKFHEINEYKNLLNAANNKNAQLTDKISTYKLEILKLNERAKERNSLIENKNSEIEELKKDCQEAAELIETLYTQKEELDLGTKHYKLENFPKDVCDFIKDLIKEYYNKK